MLVSVIIPCRNVETCLEECLESVLAQEHRDLETICVNDGSTDSTGKILDRLTSLHPSRIRTIDTQPHGPAAARNTGLAAASGEYLQFLDADDLLAPEKIRHQVALVEASTSRPALIAADHLLVGDDGTKHAVRIGSSDPWIGLIRSDLGLTSSNLFSSLPVREAGGWDGGLQSGLEYDLMFRMLKSGAPVLIDSEALTFVRGRDHGPAPASRADERWIPFIELRLKMIDFLKSGNVFSDDRLEVAHEVILNAVDRHSSALERA